MPGFADQVHSLLYARLALIQSSSASLQPDFCHCSGEQNTCPKCNARQSQTGYSACKNTQDFTFPRAVYSAEVPSALSWVIVANMNSTLNPQIPVALHKGSRCIPRLRRLHFSIVTAAWLSAAQQFSFPKCFANTSWLSLAKPHPLPIGFKGPLRSTAAAQPRGAISFSIV